MSTLISYETELSQTLEYLNSDGAIQSLDANPYWPKWHSPWWHMLLLYEMGETKQIPAAIINKYIQSLNRVPLKIFPIRPGEMPVGLDPYRESLCHCQLGNAYQVLAAWGVDVDQELPWIRPWFLRYQMADGGFNCDNDAYLVKDEVPSSMVGTIAAFEAILLYTSRPWTKQEIAFLDRGAKFLIDRKLIHGSSTKYNAAEQESAKKWFQLCFPRFYLYDSLRGLSALLIWSQKMNREIPDEAIREVVTQIKNKFPDGQLRVERHSYESVGTILRTPSGEWIRGQTATFFPLLTKLSQIGEVSPFLSSQWEKIHAFPR